MKKIIIALYIFCPIIGFFKSTFFSENYSSTVHMPKSSYFLQVVAYQKNGIEKAVSLDSCIIYKTSRDKTPFIMKVNNDGIVEKKPLTSALELDGAVWVVDIKGSQSEKYIQLLDKSWKIYPFSGESSRLIGPNSNTFTSYILRKMKFSQRLPSNAMGKDYLGSGFKWVYLGSDDGFMASFSGLLGFTFTKQHFNISILGLTLGLDWDKEIIFLPGYGDLSLDSIKSLFKSSNAN